jgi:8-oxo-dGTP pyrophosphatase MutT (NUDIX family)
MRSSNESGDREEPEWARSLKTAVGRRYSQSGAPPKKTVTVRTAAVLVLLTEGPNGVEVLLIERASGLRDYPNELSFPGGAWEEADTDPVATALREASEEIGLKPASVEIKGLLPTVIDPQAKFMVTPVLAWSASPDLTGPVDSGEVAAVHRIPVRDLAPTNGNGRHSDQARSSEKSAAPESQLGQMTAAIIDIVSALLNSRTPNDSNNIHPEPPRD